jgi:hypothetical protein
MKSLGGFGLDGCGGRGVAIGAAVVSGSVALLGFGLDSGIQAMAPESVTWTPPRSSRWALRR